MLEVLGMNSGGLIHSLEDLFHPPTLHQTIQCKRLCTDPQRSVVEWVIGIYGGELMLLYERMQKQTEAMGGLILTLGFFV